MKEFIAFDSIRPRLREVLEDSASDLTASGLHELWAVRDLTGRIRLFVPEPAQPDRDLERALAGLAERLHQRLGPRSYPPHQGLLPTDIGELELLKKGAIVEDIRGLTTYLVDRVVTAGGWAVVEGGGQPPRATRFTLFSVKGGVGRSTTAAVLAAHLARKGYRVLVVDLDLESPGVASMLTDREQPDFGIVDWFVEDLVGQGDEVVGKMVGRPSWSHDLAGDVLVVPAHVRESGEYLAKLGRVYLDLPQTEDRPYERWTRRLSRLMRALEDDVRPKVVLVDSRTGLHDLAAAAVTDLDAHVLLFGVDSEATWAGYRILFEHWNAHGVARSLRERLSLVAALLPEIEADAKLRSFCDHAWNLFRDWLYDEVPGRKGAETEADAFSHFSFDLGDEDAPHDPLPVYWNRGLAALASLRDLEKATVSIPYGRFVERFDRLLQELEATP